MSYRYCHVNVIYGMADFARQKGALQDYVAIFMAAYTALRPFILHLLLLTLYSYLQLVFLLSSVSS